MHEYEIRGDYICLPTIAGIHQYKGQGVKHVYVNLNAIARISGNGEENTCTVALVNDDSYIVPATKDELLSYIL